MTSVSPRGSNADRQCVVFISNANSGDISVLSLDEDIGGLGLIETVPAGGKVMPLAVSPDRQFLYAGLRTEPYTVVIFGIKPESGRLQELGRSPLADNFCYLSTDRTGRYLFGASYSGSRFSVNAIGPNGLVDPVPLAVVPTGKNAHAIAVDPSNRWLFVTNLGDDQILQFRFDERSGEVAPNEPARVMTQPGAGPRHFVFHPHQPLIFCLNERDCSVNGYRLEEGGSLTSIGSASTLPDGFTGKPWAADIHLTPDGRFLYTSERTSSTLAAFRVDEAGGELTLLGHSPTETQPRGFAISPSGRFLIAAGEKSDGVRLYDLDHQSGALREMSRLPVGQGPNWVAIISVPPAH